MHAAFNFGMGEKTPLRRVTLNSFDYEAGPLCQSDAPKNRMEIDPQ